MMQDKMLSQDSFDKIHGNKDYDRLKTEFFSNLSHELRTPLNVLLGTLQLLDVYLLDDKTRENYEKMYKHKDTMKQNCYRLLRLVNNIIDITRIDSGFFDISMGNYNIVCLIEDITLSVAQYIEGKQISLIFDTDVEEKIMACDPDHIERIMLNLLSNAIKFSRPGDSIFVNIQDQGNMIQVSVKDTGIGIPEDKLEIIFERFTQVDKSLTRKHEGSGIGLSLVKSLVEMHKGSITVVSEHGKGTEFVIKFPVRTIKTENGQSNAEEGIKRDNIEKIYVEFSDIYY